MDRDHGDFNSGGRANGDRSDASLGTRSERLPSIPGLPTTPCEIAAADEQADADIAAGRGIPHALVREWLLTWGTPDYKPMPREWFE